MASIRQIEGLAFLFYCSLFALARGQSSITPSPSPSFSLNSTAWYNGTMNNTESLNATTAMTTTISESGGPTKTTTSGSGSEGSTKTTTAGSGGGESTTTTTVGFGSEGSTTSTTAESGNEGSITTTTAGSGSGGSTTTTTAGSGSGGSTTTTTAGSGSGGSTTATTAGSGSGGSTTTTTAGSGSGGSTTTTTAGSGSGGSTTTTTAGSGSGGSTTTTTAGSGSRGSTTTTTAGSGSGGSTTTTTAGSGGSGGGGSGGSTAIQPTATASVLVSTSVLGSTMSAPKPYTETKISFVTEGNFKALNDEQKDALKKAFEEEVCNTTRKMYGGLVEECKVEGIRGGSIIVDMIIIFSTSNTSDVNITGLLMEVERQANQTGGIGGYKVLSTNFQIAVVQPTSSPVVTGAKTDDDDGMPGWQIALIVILVLVLIAVVIFVVFMLVVKKKVDEKETNGIPLGIQNQGASLHDEGLNKV